MSIAVPAQQSASSVSAGEARSASANAHGNHHRTLLAGGAAGALAKTAVAPLERTKILFQIGSERFSLGATRVALSGIVQSEGVVGLWRGHAATLARVVPYSAIQLATFDVVKGFLLSQQDSHNSHQQQQDLKPHLRVLAGSLAGSVSVLATYPLDLLRARLAVQSRGNFRSVFVQIYSKEGTSGFFRGLTPTLIGIIPYSGIAFGCFESIKIFMKKRNNGAEISKTEKMFGGAISGFVAQTLTYPLDVVRRRMQTDGVARTSVVSNTTETSRTNTSMLRTAKNIFISEGTYGFFKGVTLNWIKGPLAIGVSFATYDTLKELLIPPTR